MHNQQDLHQRFPHWLEIAALLALLGLALFLRLWRLDEVPVGLHFDEAIDLKISFDIVHGARPLYVADGWGREALFYYIVALVLQIVPYNPLALRVAAIIWSGGVLATSYLLGRLWHGRLTALLLIAWLGATYWPLSASRFGLRHNALAVTLGLAIWMLWRTGARQPPPWWRWALAGALLGLTLYTYQPARFVPFIPLFFALYLFLFHRHTAWAQARPWLLYAATFLLIATPFIIVLSQQGSLETEQRAFVIEPLTQLLAGNVQPLLANTLDTLQAFTVRGDPLQSYNVPQRPIFVPAWTGLFFYAGLLLALWRWRQPRYALVLLWLGFTLLPTIVTISAPNFNRMVAAQLPIMFLAALSLSELAQWLWARYGRAGQSAAVLLVMLTFATTTQATWRDYFDIWPNQYGDAPVFNRYVSAVADHLEHDPDSRPVVISSRNIDDEDPYVVTVSMDRRDVEIRWVDTSQALALPAGAAEARLLVTADRWIDERLSIWPALDSDPLAQQPEFTRWRLSAEDWINAAPTPLGIVTPDTPYPTTDTVQALAPPYPHPFCDCAGAADGPVALWLTGLTLDAQREAGQPLEMITSWQTVAEANFASLALFVHLVDETGAIVTQYDGLGYPPHTWRTGDRFVQLARLSLPPELATGRYWLQFGLYERGTGQRWQLLDPNGRVVTDRLIIGPLRLDAEGFLRVE